MVYVIKIIAITKIEYESAYKLTNILAFYNRIRNCMCTNIRKHLYEYIIT
jgi:hypothetical protein